ncbi:hypothetical protein [Hamadaea tsunoensis]|uniref:hypothetical protein n=1 Tax=Hamadaea tsunoensis TaxID=53368 RepID=UPI0004298E34|nr:hypothetical protein [Hamadaea tsunoensis]
MSQSGLAERKPVTSAATTPARSGAVTAVAVIGLVWLAVTLAVGHGSLHGRAGDVALSTAVLSLPALVQAALFGAASVSLAITAPLVATRTRVLVAVGTGAVVGALAAAPILLAYGIQASAARALAATVVIAGGIGGAIGAARPVRMIAAGLLATLPVLILEYVFGVGPVASPLLKLFGGDGTAAHNYSASGYVGMTTALVEGLVAGIVGYLLVRGRSFKPWAYALAGGLPGLVIGAAEVFTRLAGSWLLSMASEVSVLDKTLYAWGEGNRTNQALVVFFIGTLAALIGYGRSIKRPTE